METESEYNRRFHREERLRLRGRSRSRSREDDGYEYHSPRQSLSKRDLQSRLTSRTPSPTIPRSAHGHIGNGAHRHPPSRTPSPGAPRHLHRLPVTRPVSPYERGRTREVDRGRGGGGAHQPPTAPLSWRRSPPRQPPTQPAAFFARERERQRDREHEASPRLSQYGLPPHDLPSRPNTLRLPPSLPPPPPSAQAHAPTPPGVTKGYMGGFGGGIYIPRGPAAAATSAAYAPSSYSRGRSKSMSRSPSRSRSSERSRSRGYWEREMERNRDAAERQRERDRERSRASGFGLDRA